MLIEKIIKNFDDYRIGEYEGKTYAAVLLSYQSKGFTPKKHYGLISKYSWGRDYHQVMKERILDTFGSDIKFYVDSKEINERKVAMHLGLGTIGKNNLLLNKKYGSFFFIGIVELNDSTFNSKQVEDFNPCINCNKCESACPTQAIGNYKLDESKCLSNVSQQKIPFSLEQVRQIQSNIFGCDICQNVCPVNESLHNDIVDDFKATNVYIDLKEIFTLTNTEFLSKYANKACTWRGKLVMQRNACCVAFNQDLKELKPLIEQSIPNTPMWYQETIELILKNWK